MQQNTQQTHLIQNGARLNLTTAVDLIKSYTPLDGVSSRYKKWFLELIDETPDFANRYAYDPGHLTAQAIVVNTSLRAVAMILHKKLNVWVMFGGHAEPGDEDLIATARREAVEEGGLTDITLIQETPFDIDIHGFPARGDQPDHLHYDVRLLFETKMRDLVLNADEGNQVEWVKISDLRSRMPEWLSNNRLVRELQTRFG